jgi:hypothetical protein
MLLNPPVVVNIVASSQTAGELHEKALRWRHRHG